MKEGGKRQARERKKVESVRKRGEEQGGSRDMLGRQRV